MNKLSPSILSADFTELGSEIRLCEQNNVPYLHIDVMDGMFVPNISIGVPVVKSIRKITDLVLDVHLMIVEPQRYIEAFANAGADIINIHYESTAKENILPTLKSIRELGKSPALTIKPKTSYEDVIEYAPYVDMFLVMSVEPGFGGQSFIESTLDNVRGLYNYKEQNNLKYDIEIDGGVGTSNLQKVLDAGANVIVAGSAIFGKKDKAAEINKFLSIME